MEKQAETWFRLAVFNGLEKVARLSLIGKPRTADEINDLTDIFVEAAWPGKSWNHYRDFSRVNAAFAALSLGTRADRGDPRRFPLPADFVACIPRVEREPLPEPEKKGKPLTVEDIKIGVEKLQGFLARNPVMGKSTPPPVSDKLGRVNFYRRQRGLREFKTQVEWDEFAMDARERQRKSLERIENADR